MQAETEANDLRTTAQDKTKNERAPSQSLVYISTDRKVERFSDRPQRPSEPTINEWVRDVKGHIASRSLSDREQSNFILNHLGGKARREIDGRGADILDEPESILKVLIRVFGEGESLARLQQRFFSYKQREGDDLLTCSLELIDLYDKIIQGDASFKACRNTNLKGRLAEATRDEGLRRELRRLNIEKSSINFFEMRDQALEWYGKSTKSPTSHPRMGIAEEVVSEVPLADIVQKQSEQIKAQQKQIEELIKVFQGHQVAPQRRQNSITPQRQNEPFRCYQCNQVGHMKRDCRQRSRPGLN